MKQIAMAVLIVLGLASHASAGPGWYVMAPPLYADLAAGTLEFKINYSAPLNMWDQGTAYDSARACQDALNEWNRVDQMSREIRERLQRKQTIGELTAERFANGKCVMADDPRLAAAPTPKPPKAAAPSQQGEDSRAEALTWDMGIIRYTPGRPIVAVVRLNGRSSARLILDTGADGSMVKSELLAAAGVDLSRPAARGEIGGIAGKAKVSYFPVIFEVAGHRVRVPRVAAFFDGDSADGLLGRDFLDHFKVLMDPAAGTVTLVPR